MKTIRITLEVEDTNTRKRKEIVRYVDHAIATQCAIPSDRYLVKEFESMIDTFRQAHPGEI